jgi:LuxR family transcriptional regulator, maltose regulon positive regulatory protein
MLTLRATLRDNIVTFIDPVDLPYKGEQQILVTFLDSNTTIFQDLSQREVAKLVSNARFGLSDREIEVLKLARQGLTNDQIGDQLEIGQGTVRNYLSSVYEKLKVNNRTGAISKAIEHGLLD